MRREHSIRKLELLAGTFSEKIIDGFHCGPCPKDIERYDELNFCANRIYFDSVIINKKTGEIVESLTNYVSEGYNFEI